MLIPEIAFTTVSSEVLQYQANFIPAVSRNVDQMV